MSRLRPWLDRRGWALTRLGPGGFALGITLILRRRGGWLPRCERCGIALGKWSLDR